MLTKSRCNNREGYYYLPYIAPIRLGWKFILKVFYLILLLSDLTPKSALFQMSNETRLRSSLSDERPSFSS